MKTADILDEQEAQLRTAERDALRALTAAIAPLEPDDADNSALGQAAADLEELFLLVVVAEGVLGGILGRIISPRLANPLGILIGILINPFGFTALILLYYDIRLRKEGTTETAGIPPSSPAEHTKYLAYPQTNKLSSSQASYDAKTGVITLRIPRAHVGIRAVGSLLAHENSFGRRRRRRLRRRDGFGTGYGRRNLSKRR